MRSTDAALESRDFTGSQTPSRSTLPISWDFLYGLPAAAAGFLVILFALVLTTVHEPSTLNFYVDEASRLEHLGEYDEALVCYERLTRLRPTREDFAYGKARVLEALGHADQAAVILNGLAPRDRPGYAPAHLLLANRALIALNQNAKAREVIEPHLLNFLKLTPDPASETEARALLGKFYVAEGRYADAEAQLQKVFRERPDVLLPLARAAAALGKTAYARERASEARAFYQRKLKEPGNADNITYRIEAADAAFFLGDFSEAESILLEGLARSREVRLHAALSMVYVEWYKAVKKDPKVPQQDRLVLLERGLQHAPTNPALIDCLLEVLKKGGPDSERARGALRSILAEGKAPAVVHFALGMDDWERGQPESARVHLREAVALAPEFLIAANNLAMFLAFGPKANPTEALQVIDRVIERRPDVAEYRDTRGRVLTALGRWQEALPDLEIALKTYPKSATLHEALADAYGHLGMAEMAKEHKRLAAEGKNQ